jgi:hypothetical protein
MKYQLDINGYITEPLDLPQVVSLYMSGILTLDTPTKADSETAWSKLCITLPFLASARTSKDVVSEVKPDFGNPIPHLRVEVAQLDLGFGNLSKQILIIALSSLPTVIIISVIGFLIRAILAASRFILAYLRKLSSFIAR